MSARGNWKGRWTFSSEAAAEIVAGYDMVVEDIGIICGSGRDTNLQWVFFETGFQSRCKSVSSLGGWDVVDRSGICHWSRYMSMVHYNYNWCYEWKSGHGTMSARGQRRWYSRKRPKQGKVWRREEGHMIVQLAVAMKGGRCVEKLDAEFARE